MLIRYLCLLIFSISTNLYAETSLWENGSPTKHTESNKPLDAEIAKRNKPERVELKEPYDLGFLYCGSTRIKKEIASTLGVVSQAYTCGYEYELYKYKNMLLNIGGSVEKFKRVYDPDYDPINEGPTFNSVIYFSSLYAEVGYAKAISFNKKLAAGINVGTQFYRGHFEYIDDQETVRQAVPKKPLYLRPHLKYTLSDGHIIFASVYRYQSGGDYESTYNVGINILGW